MYIFSNLVFGTLKLYFGIYILKDTRLLAIIISIIKLSCSFIILTQLLCSKKNIPSYSIVDEIIGKLKNLIKSE